MTKFHKAIIKLNPTSVDVEEFVELNNLEVDKPLSVILKKVNSQYIQAKDNSNFKWPSEVLCLALTTNCDEFEIILKGRELSPTEVEDIKKSTQTQLH